MNVFSPEVFSSHGSVRAAPPGAEWGKTLDCGNEVNNVQIFFLEENI